ncbi:MAG: HzsA-related protein [Pirellulaceae bacterium]
MKRNTKTKTKTKSKAETKTKTSRKDLVLFRFACSLGAMLALLLLVRAAWPAEPTTPAGEICADRQGCSENGRQEPCIECDGSQTSATGQPTDLILTTSATGILHREITEEAFAAIGAGMGADRNVSVLATSIEFAPQEARYVRLIIRRPHAGAPCLDELEVYGPDPNTNLALASRGAVARASSLLAGYAIHAVAHLNDGLYGNDHSWIAATEGEEWAEIELPAPALVASVVLSRDRDWKFTDRQILEAEVHVSCDGQTWQTAGTLRRAASDLPRPIPRLAFPMAELPEPTWAGAVTYAFLRERETWSRMDATDYLSPLRHDRPAVPGGEPYWGRLARHAPLERVLVQLEEMLERLAALGLDVGQERVELAELRRQALEPSAADSDALFLAARHAKRRLFFRDPRLAPLERVLFAKRHPLHPSHNYSDHMDSLFAPGGGICVLYVPRDADGRFDPARGEVETLFDGSAGIARDPVADFDAQNIYFAYRPDKSDVEGWQPYWHLMSVRADGSGLQQLTEGPFHDFDPVALPDGGLGFMSTRCAVRFLCWEPQAYVLYRMETDGSDLRRLSFANLSEWEPAVMRDGRILWTRSEYQDKGADFGHTLWAIRPDGGHPELVFGNDTPYCYGHAREVPGSQEIVCTLISHGDHQGPIALLDVSRGRYNTAAITNITPDTRPQYQMDRSHQETFRDAEPISHDHFLVSHNPGQASHWGLYVIDRFGNRELLYLDPAISSKRPSPLRARPRPPVLPAAHDAALAQQGLGQFTIQDVYEGLGSTVARGQAKYLQVSQEVPANLEKLACGEYRSTHPSFQDFYATPIHLVTGPRHSYATRLDNALQPHAFRAGSATAADDGTATITEDYGWPSFVAKAVLGTVQIAEDGSTNFTAPAGKVLYFHLLDENFNELQRMRSVVQLQPGEQRSCIGCHDARSAAPPRHVPQSLTQERQALVPPPWGAVAFDFERVVQPVLDAKCVRCHDMKSDVKLDLRGNRDGHRVPASYRALIAGGWVHYFDWHYGARHFKAEPLSFGTLQSPLFAVLADEVHREVTLTSDERRALTAWIDLNCPLWPDYRYREERPQ